MRKRNVPPAAAPIEFISRLSAGYALTAEELVLLRSDGDQASALERSDNNFLRASRKAKAGLDVMRQSEAVQRAIDEKERMSEVAQARRHEHAMHQREIREQREARHKQQLAEASQAKAERQQRVYDKIVRNQHKALVRDTVRDALLSQSRSESMPEREIGEKLQGLWTPGPQAYDKPQLGGRSSSFGYHKPVKKFDHSVPRPGPGTYNPRNPETIKYSFHGAARHEMHHAPLPGIVSPGPAAYKPPDKHLRRYQSIHKYPVKDSLDAAMVRARALPGPSDYQQKDRASFGASKSLGWRPATTSYAEDARLRETPGPSSYRIEEHKNIRGGTMAGPGWKPSLSKGVPGPGNYFPSLTMAQEREMKRVRKEVTDLLKRQQQQEDSAARGELEGRELGSPRSAPGERDGRALAASPPRDGQSAFISSSPHRRYQQERRRIQRKQCGAASSPELDE